MSQLPVQPALTHWELRALIRHHLAVVDRITDCCPQPKAVQDLQPSIDRLNEIVALYLATPKEEVGE